MTTYNSENTPLWLLQDDKRMERILLPWRRMLARSVDFLFYLLLWWTAAYLVFRRNVILLHWIPCSAVMFAISLAVMFILEPVLLALFGTTPGKMLFGIRLRQKQGGKLTLAQGYKRLLVILSHGCGYVILPIYNLVRLYKAYKICQVEGVTKWDEGFALETTGNFRAQIVRGIVAALVVASLLTVVYFVGDMPVNRGGLTVSQLEENVDNYWRFHGTAWNTELFYTVNLQFYDISAGYIFDRMDPPEVVIEETDGIVTAVSFEFSDVSRTVLMALPTWLRGYAVSYVGARGNVFNVHAPGGAVDSLLDPVARIIKNRAGTESVRFTTAGVEVSFDITAGEYISASFSMRLV